MSKYQIHPARLKNSHQVEGTFQREVILIFGNSKGYLNMCLILSR